MYVVAVVLYSSHFFFQIPGRIAQQASVYHGQAYALPCQFIRKRFHQEKEQMVSYSRNLKPYYLQHRNVEFSIGFLDASNSYCTFS